MLKVALIIIIMLVIVALIISAANDYRAERIRIRFDEEDHICEQCGEIIPVEHPCNCQKCWNDAISKSVKLTSRMDRLKDQIERLAREMETDQRGNKLDYWVIGLRKISAEARPLPSECNHEDVLLLDEDDRPWKVCYRCQRKERASN